MRDIVGDLAHRRHQTLDLLEHPVEIGGELIELVPGAVQRDALGEIAGHYALAGPVDLLDPAQQVAAHHAAAGETRAERDKPGPQQRRPDPAAKG